MISLPVAAAAAAAAFALADGAVLQLVMHNPRLQSLIFGLGALSALALALMIGATRLNLALFGLLSYVKPVLLVLVALLLGERIAPARLTYGASGRRFWCL